VLLLFGTACFGTIAFTTDRVTFSVLWNIATVAGAWATPATSMIVAGWVDGHALGTALGLISVASRISPSAVYLVYGALLDGEDCTHTQSTTALTSLAPGNGSLLQPNLVGTPRGAFRESSYDLDSYKSSRLVDIGPWEQAYSLRDAGDVPGAWRRGFALAAIIYAAVLLVYVLLLRPSAKAMGFRVPTPPGKKKGHEEGSKLSHPMARASMCEMLGGFFGELRTWYLLLSFSLLMCLKQGARFATLYAKEKLDARCDQNGDMLLFAYALSSVVSGVLGGKLYDLILTKRDIGWMITILNLMNLGGFVYILVLEATDSVTWTGLYIFMIVIGFSSILPASLPFQVYAISRGGVKHTGLLVSIFELAALGTGVLLELGFGGLLKEKNYTKWLLLYLVSAALPGTFFMALFYYEEWKKAPSASNYGSAPILDVEAKHAQHDFVDPPAPGTRRLDLPSEAEEASRMAPSRSRMSQHVQYGTDWK